jgi:hypothetical protein
MVHYLFVLQFMFHQIMPFIHSFIQVFKQELAFASHLSVSAMILQPPTPDCANYCRCVNQALISLQGMRLWVPIPLASSLSTSQPSSPIITANSTTTQEMCEDSKNKEHTGTAVENKGEDYHWKAWRTMKLLCEEHPKLGVGKQ